ncbi:hypothetical protein ENTCAN_06897 [Enterobacter cancerogenus ATCC 35316]|nr:hypothetical protein ENTCAN_06897 [Enterobacter cancerogenus ATCC 35316]
MHFIKRSFKLIKAEPFKHCSRIFGSNVNSAHHSMTHALSVLFNSVFNKKVVTSVCCRMRVRRVHE